MTHTECTNCGSRDNMYTYEDGAYCFGCKTKMKPEGNNMVETPIRNTGGLVEGVDYRAIPARGLHLETCKFFRYGISTAPHPKTKELTPCHVAPHYKDGHLVAQHLRFQDKTMPFRGDASSLSFWGQDLFDGGKRLYITEGEIDAMSVYQVFDKPWPVVSLPNGVNSAEKVARNNLNFLEKFEEIVLVPDQDEAGAEMVKAFERVVTPGKLKVVYLPMKDANEMILANRHQDLRVALWNAKKKSPEELVYLHEVADKLWEPKQEPLVVYPYKTLQEKTGGVRPKELVVLTAGKGVGKSTLCREMLNYNFKHGDPNLKYCYMGLEEGPEDCLFQQMSIELERNLQVLGREGISDEAYQKAADIYMRGDRILAYNHFGSQDVDTILSHITFCVTALGVKVVFVDHLTMIIGGLDGDDRKTIDIFLTKLRSLTQRFDFSCVMVSHIARKVKDGQTAEEGCRISSADLRGSSSIEGLADQIIALERDQQAEAHNNMCRVRVLKSRKTGFTGVADWVIWKQNRHRLVQATEGEVEEYQAWIKKKKQEEALAKRGHIQF